MRADAKLVEGLEAVAAQLLETSKAVSALPTWRQEEINQYLTHKAKDGSTEAKIVLTAIRGLNQ